MCENPASLLVSVVKNHEFIVTHVVLNQEADSILEGPGRWACREQHGQWEKRSPLSSAWARPPLRVLGPAPLGSHLPHVHRFPKCSREPVVSRRPGRTFSLVSHTPFLLWAALYPPHPTPFMCWSCNFYNLSMWLYLETGPLKRQIN